MSETNTIQMSNRARNAGQKLAAAFIEEHGCKPSEALIEFGRLPNGKSTCRIRKLTELEKDIAEDAQAKRELDALRVQDKPCVWAPILSMFQSLTFTTKVYLSKANAEAASRRGKARKIEVRP
jgi:hypothetical protein